MNRLIFVIAALGVLLSPCLCSTSTSTSETTAEQVTQNPTPGPNDLTTTDYIIIGVTSGVCALTIIGGLIYCIRYSQTTQKEKNAEYAEYLRQDEMQGIKEGGITNAGYEAPTYPPGNNYNGNVSMVGGIPYKQGPSSLDAAALARHSQMVMKDNPYQNNSLTHSQLLTQMPTSTMTGSAVSQITVPNPAEASVTPVQPQPESVSAHTAGVIVTTAVVTPPKTEDVYAVPQKQPSVVSAVQPVVASTVTSTAAAAAAAAVVVEESKSVTPVVDNKVSQLDEDMEPTRL